MLYSNAKTAGTREIPNPLLQPSNRSRGSNYYQPVPVLTYNDRGKAPRVDVGDMNRFNVYDFEDEDDLNYFNSAMKNVINDNVTYEEDVNNEKALGWFTQIALYMGCLRLLTQSRKDAEKKKITHNGILRAAPHGAKLKRLVKSLRTQKITLQKKLKQLILEREEMLKLWHNVEKRELTNQFELDENRQKIGSIKLKLDAVDKRYAKAQSSYREFEVSMGVLQDDPDMYNANTAFEIIGDAIETRSRLEGKTSNVQLKKVRKAKRHIQKRELQNNLNSINTSLADDPGEKMAKVEAYIDKLDRDILGIADEEISIDVNVNNSENEDDDEGSNNGSSDDGGEGFLDENLLIEDT